MALFFNSFKQANSFLKQKEFLNINNFIAYIPKNLITCRGLIRGVYVNFSQQELSDNLKLIGSNKSLIEVRRIKKPSVLEGNRIFLNTSLVVFTIRGTVLPDKISLFMCALDTEEYIFPITPCFNCLR